MKLEKPVEDLIERVKDLEIQNGIKQNVIHQYQELVDKVQLENWELVDKCTKQKELLDNYHQLKDNYDKLIDRLNDEIHQKDELIRINRQEYGALHEAFESLGGWGAVNGNKV